MSEVVELPIGWKRMKLRDVGTWYGGGTPSKFEPRFWTGGNIPWISPKDMKSLHVVDSQDHLSTDALDETNVRRFPRGTVLLVIRSGILSRTLPVGIAEVSATMNQDLKGVRPQAGIDSTFVAYQLIGREREVLKECAKHGTTVASIDTERLHDFELRIAPSAEQNRIVAKIEELFSDLDAGVTALKRVKANLKRYRAAVLKAAVEGRLTEAWRKKNPNVEPAAKLLERILTERRTKWEADQLRKFKEAGKTPPAGWKPKYALPLQAGAHDQLVSPEGWLLTSLDALLSQPLRNGHSSKRSETGSGVRTLTLTAVTYGDFAEHNTKLTVANPDAVEDLWLMPGDILIERSNTSELVGTARVYRGPRDFAIFPDLLIRARVVPAINDRFLEIVLESRPARLFFRKRAVGTAGSMPKIDQETIQRLPLPLPQLVEQAEIVAEVDRRLSVADAAETQVEHALQRAARLRQSIFKRAFEGKLVAQDPSDEPAAGLLGRIKPATNGLHPAPTKPATRRSRARV